ncbi:hypothetical protein ACLOJK_015115, partial [Asimina triloba]
MLFDEKDKVRRNQKDVNFWHLGYQMTKCPGDDVKVVDKTLSLSETEKGFNRHVIVDDPFKESRSHAPFPLGEGEESADEDVIIDVDCV